MVNIIVQLSKYLMILMITVYTYLCFSIFGYYDPDKKETVSQKAECVDVRDASDSISRDVSGKKRTQKILALYLMQVTLLGGTILLYSFIYPKVSRLVVNNMCMLLSIGFIMITRLNYDKAAKQYLIAAAGIVLLSCNSDHHPEGPFLIRMENPLWNCRNCIAGGGCGCRKSILWCDAWFYGCGNQYSAVGAGEDRICVLCSIQF